MSLFGPSVQTERIDGRLEIHLAEQVAHIEAEVFGTLGQLKHARVCSLGSVTFANVNKDMHQRHWFLGTTAPGVRPSAEHGNSVEGYLLLTDQQDGSLYLDDLAVLPRVRRRGLARILVKDALEYAGGRNVFTWVRTGDEAENFYAALGFVAQEESDRSSACFPGETVRKWTYNPGG